jgi:hypothetical protein
VPKDISRYYSELRPKTQDSRPSFAEATEGRPIAPNEKGKYGRKEKAENI